MLPAFISMATLLRYRFVIIPAVAMIFVWPKMLRIMFEARIFGVVL